MLNIPLKDTLLLLGHHTQEETLSRYAKDQNEEQEKYWAMLHDPAQVFQLVNLKNAVISLPYSNHT